MNRVKQVDVVFRNRDVDSHSFLGVTLLPTPEGEGNGGRPFFRIEKREDGNYLLDGYGKGDSLPGAEITLTRDSTGKGYLSFLNGLRVDIEEFAVVEPDAGYSYFMVYEHPDGTWRVCNTRTFFNAPVTSDLPPVDDIDWNVISISLPLEVQ